MATTLVPIRPRAAPLATRPGRRIVAIATALTLAGALGTGDAATTDPPAADVIGQTIGAMLPGYWTVQSLQLTDPVDYGNAVDPDWRWRFEAALTPKEALYVDAGDVEGVVLLEPTLTPESRESLYGTVRATFRAGRWNPEVSLENRPFDGRGLPGSFFAGRTAVLGSEEEQAVRDNAHQRFVERLEEQHARQRAATEQRHKTELVQAGAVHRQELAELEKRHETALAALRMKLAADAQQQAEDLSAAEQQHRTNLAQAEAVHRHELAMLEQQHESALAALEAKLAADAELQREAFAAEEALRSVEQEGMRTATVSAEQLTALAAQTETTMATLEAQLETLAAAEAETLAATARVVKGREEALQTLLGELDTAATAERYRIVLDTVSKTDAPWLLESALRHGLSVEDRAMRRHAWLRLLQSDFIDTPNGQTVLAEHVHTLEDEPILLTFLVSKVGPKLAASPTVLRMLTARLPSIEQWAAEVESYSSEHSGRFDAAHVLGAADAESCNSFDQEAWRPYRPSGTHSIRVAFETPVLLPTVTVHEVGGVAFVRKLTLWAPEGESTAYDVEDPMFGCGGAAKFRLYQHPTPVVAVTVTIEWSDDEAIDAILLAGIPIVTSNESGES